MASRRGTIPPRAYSGCCRFWRIRSGIGSTDLMTPRPPTAWPLDSPNLVSDPPWAPKSFFCGPLHTQIPRCSFQGSAAPRMRNFTPPLADIHAMNHGDRRASSLLAGELWILTTGEWFDYFPKIITSPPFPKRCAVSCPRRKVRSQARIFYLPPGVPGFLVDCLRLS